MPTLTTLQKAKTALRVTTDAFNDEIGDLIAAAVEDLRLVGISDGVLASLASFPLAERAVITYCRVHFGQPEDYDRLKASYDEQKAQMKTYSAYNGGNCGSL